MCRCMALPVLSYKVQAGKAKEDNANSQTNRLIANPPEDCPAQQDTQSSEREKPANMPPFRMLPVNQHCHNVRSKEDGKQQAYRSLRRKADRKNGDRQVPDPGQAALANPDEEGTECGEKELPG